MSVCNRSHKWQPTRFSVWVSRFFSSFAVSWLESNCLLRLFHLSFSCVVMRFIVVVLTAAAAAAATIFRSFFCVSVLFFRVCAVTALLKILSFVIWLKPKLICHSHSWHTFACLALNDRRKKNSKQWHQFRAMSIRSCFYFNSMLNQFSHSFVSHLKHKIYWSFFCVLNFHPNRYINVCNIDGHFARYAVPA